MSLPRFTFIGDTTIRTDECEDCGVTHSWAEASRRRYCDTCRVARKKASDRGKPQRIGPTTDLDDDIGRAVGFDCLHLPERCERKQCRHHLGTDIGTPDCAVRVANEKPDGVELAHIGRWFGLSRERIRQVEDGATRKIRSRE